MPRALVLGFILAVAAVTAVAEETANHESHWVEVDLDGEVSADLLRPEGRTRWDLREVATGRGWARTIQVADGGAVVVSDRTGSAPAVTFEISDPTGGDAAARWILVGGGDALFDAHADRRDDLSVVDGDGAHGELRVETRRVGLGWLFLPSGPREVVLQRARVLERHDGRWQPLQIVHRWIDPGAGVVARIWGPAAADGVSRRATSGAEFAEQITRGTSLKIFADEIDHPVPPPGVGSVPGMHFRLAYGYDVQTTCADTFTPCVDSTDCGGGACEKHIGSLTTPSYATAGDLIGATSWNFTPVQLSTSAAEIASTTAPVNSSETCSWDQCGFNQPGAKLTREDTAFDDPPNTSITVNAQEREDRAGDVTLWLRGVVNKEGESGGIADGESRVCHVGLDVEGTQRPDVPLWRFSHQDGAGQPFYMQNGDSWTHAPFPCVQNIFNHLCGTSCGFFCSIYIQACDTHTGTQSSEVVAEGPVTLPSGHTFNSLVVRNTADFCVFLLAGCSGGGADQVETVTYQWVVPWMGTVARLQSKQVALPDAMNFTTLELSDIKFGLFPPVSITAGAVTDTTIEVSWDPGSITHRIDGYKIYWNTDSAVSTPYAFNSVDNAGQVTINGTTATISGLAPGTSYFVTVTAQSDYANPSSGVLTPYESLLYPLTVGGTPAAMPAEVTVMTTGGACTPTEEVTGVTIGRVSPGTCEICWDPSTDPCLDGYQILGADAPSAPASFTPVVPDTGLVTCHTFSPTESFFLVVTKGTGGTGPWGHFGQ